MNNLIEKQLKELVAAFEAKELKEKQESTSLVTVSSYKLVPVREVSQVFATNSNKIEWKSLNYFKGCEKANWSLKQENLEINLLANPFYYTARQSGRTTSILNILMKKLNDSIIKGKTFDALVISRDYFTCQWLARQFEMEFNKSVRKNIHWNFAKQQCEFTIEDQRKKDFKNSHRYHVKFTSIGKIINDCCGNRFDLILSDVSKKDLEHEKLVEIYHHLWTYFKENNYNIQAYLTKAITSLKVGIS